MAVVIQGLRPLKMASAQWFNAHMESQTWVPLAPGAHVSVPLANEHSTANAAREYVMTGTKWRLMFPD